MEEKLKELSEYFISVEADVKRIEIETDEVLIPALNQLRYYGNHISRAITADTEATKREELIRAQRHLARSRYDAFEHGSIDLFLKIDDFRDRFRGLGKVVAETIPDYFNKIGEFEELKQSSERNRRTIGEEQTHAPSKIETLEPSEKLASQDEEIASSTKDCFEFLRKLDLCFEEAEPLIIDAVNKENEETKRKYRQFLITLIVSLIGLLLTLGLLFFSAVRAIPVLEELRNGPSTIEETADPNLEQSED